MIEILEGSTLKLPKNIRQIGTPDSRYHIYMEDYVYTFLHPRKGMAVRQEEEETTVEDWNKSLSVLIGKKEQNEKGMYLFINGAIRVDGVCFSGDTPELEEDFWEPVFQEMKKYFEEQDVLGWALDMKGSPLRLTPEVEKLHRKYFGADFHILYIADSVEKEEVFYAPSGQVFLPLDGYYIYYEKNVSMQEYMVHRKELLREKNDVTRQEPEKEAPGKKVTDKKVTDKKVTVDPDKEHYRSLLSGFSGKRESFRWRTALYTGSMVAVMAACAVTVSLFNNYRKMLDLESAVSVLSQETTESTEGNAKVQRQEVKVSSIAGDGTFLSETAVSQPGTAASSSETAVSQSDTAANASSGTEQQSDEAASQSGTAVNTPSATEQQPDEAASQPDTAANTSSGTEQQPVTAAAAEEDMTGAAAASQPVTATEAAAPVQSEAEMYLAQGYYIVKEGDSLITISQKIYGTKAMTEEIRVKNGIENWDLIYTGQRLELP